MESQPVPSYTLGHILFQQTTWKRFEVFYICITLVHSTKHSTQISLIPDVISPSVMRLQL